MPNGSSCGMWREGGGGGVEEFLLVWAGGMVEKRVYNCQNYLEGLSYSRHEYAFYISELKAQEKFAL